MNRQVIEVVDTGSPCFERALLVVDPRSDVDQSELYAEAARIFGGGRRAKMPAPLAKFMLAGGCTALGAAVTAILMKLLS